MIFHIIILVLISLGSHGRLCFSHQPQPPTNQSNPNTSFPVNQIGSQLLGHSTPPSQSNQTSSSPAYPTQQEQNTHSPRHSTLPGQNYLNPQFPMRGPPSPAHPPPPGWSSNQSPSVPSDDPTIVSLVGSTKPEELNPSMSGDPATFSVVGPTKSKYSDSSISDVSASFSVGGSLTSTTVSFFH
ncbi:hypothetical protein F2Q68_00027149 [Brassica cretica]|uniref:Uncharacterized protein n=1 Tax=Brassica cretica TaxID=69181 RepID=A0A8S9IGH5_BRACR|nr:hypothetical protein F2Q68_00027149 [Brassica cretica]